jgi:hypothetical protein
MYASLLAALQSIPLILEALQSLKETYRDVQEGIQTRKYQELRSEVRETIKLIDNARSNEDRQKLATRLANAVSE